MSPSSEVVFFLGFFSSALGAAAAAGLVVSKQSQERSCRLSHGTGVLLAIHKIKCSSHGKSLSHHDRIHANDRIDCFAGLGLTGGGSGGRGGSSGGGTSTRADVGDQGSNVLSLEGLGEESGPEGVNL